MSKKPFTTRIDEDVLSLAQRLADDERRSVTSLIEVAVLEYAANRRVRALLPEKEPQTAEAGRRKSAGTPAARPVPRAEDPD
jgi:hypothetical protein